MHGRIAWSVTCSVALYIGRARAQTDHQSPARTLRGNYIHGFASQTLSPVELQPPPATYIYSVTLKTSFPHRTNMIDVAQKPRDGCLYEIRQKGQKDPFYVVVPNTTVCFTTFSLCWLCLFEIFDEINLQCAIKFIKTGLPHRYHQLISLSNLLRWVVAFIFCLFIIFHYLSFIFIHIFKLQLLMLLYNYMSKWFFIAFDITCIMSRLCSFADHFYFISH